MIYIQVVTEVEVDEDTLADRFPDEWEQVLSYRGDLQDLAVHLLETKVATVEDLGEVEYTNVSVL
jgi:hypothetical protein